MPLDTEQIAHFKTHGFVRIPGFVDPATLAGWRAQIWQGLGAQENDRGTWPDHQRALVGFRFQPEETEPARYEPLLEIVKQLGGGDFGWGPDDFGDGGAPILK
ncbi:MAG: hypothetical protein FJY97_18875 [candidate division Zixibacteria bacterium]|nr:hypothetical protein [candidate division Zixibacteria bacterium]